MSLFADALGKLIDQPGLWTRDEWNEILDLKTGEIEDWLADRRIPTPRQLCGVLSVARENSRTQKNNLKEWNEMALRPAEEVSPLGKEFGETVRHYMVKPVFEGFMRCFSCLQPWVQEKLCYEASALCRKYLDEGPEPDPRTLIEMISEAVEKIEHPQG